MALHNINTIQNPSDFTYIHNEAINNYMYESLANLGQRFSPKGDGIKSNHFNIIQVLKLNEGKYKEPSKYITKMYINNGKLFLSILDKNNIKGKPADNIEPVELLYTLNNGVYTDVPITLNTKINGIDYYKENMLMFIDNTSNLFYIASLGCDADLGIIELNLESYNIITNKLVESVKFIDTNEQTINAFENNTSDNIINYYYLYHLVRTSNENDKYESDKYELFDYKINSSNINESFQTIALSFYNIIIQYYKEYKELNINNIVNELIQFGFSTNRDENPSLPVILNKNNNYEFSIDTTQTLTEDGYGDINAILHYIYNQTVHMYLYIFEYYCSCVYKLDNTQLQKKLLYSIFKQAFIESEGNRLYEENINLFEMYIPVNYTFDYYVNENDEFYIYSNETPVNIFYTTNTISQEYIDVVYGSENQLILCPSPIYETVSLFKFSVIYNNLNRNIINSISVQKLFSTPYIEDDFWVINNKKTVYRALGQDAGNPNIVMLYVDNQTKGKIISSINDFDYLFNNSINNSITLSKTVEIPIKLFEPNFVETLVQFERDRNNEIKLNDIYNIKTIEPTIDVTFLDDNIKTQFKNAFIVTLTDINNIKYTNDYKSDKELNDATFENIISLYYGDTAFITTFWKYDNNLNKFNYVKDPLNSDDIAHKDCALTLTNMTNVNLLFENLQGIIKNLHDVVNNESKNFSYLFIASNEPKNNITKSTRFISYLTHLQNKYNTYLTYNYSNNVNLNNNNIITLFSIGDTWDSGKLRTVTDWENIGYTGYNINYSEYIPKGNVPSIDLSEILIHNQQVLNRTNIVSLDGNSNIYYSYIGTSPSDKRKNVLHIGSSKINTSIGHSYLLEPGTEFIVQDTLSVDFNTVESNCKYNKISKNVSTITELYDCAYCLNSKYSINKDELSNMQKYFFIADQDKDTINIAKDFKYNTSYSSYTNGEYLEDYFGSYNYVYFNHKDIDYIIFELNNFIKNLTNRNIIIGTSISNTIETSNVYIINSSSVIQSSKYFVAFPVNNYKLYPNYCYQNITIEYITDPENNYISKCYISMDSIPNAKEIIYTL